MSEKIKCLSAKERRMTIKHLAAENNKYGVTFAQIEIPNTSDTKRFAVWRNFKFLAQLFQEAHGIIRISVNRTSLNARGDWKEDISWEELQGIKNALGFSEQDAVEIFPAANDVVNVANMRHLWVMPEPLGFGWKAR